MIHHQFLVVPSWGNEGWAASCEVLAHAKVDLVELLLKQGLPCHRLELSGPWDPWVSASGRDMITGVWWAYQRDMIASWSFHHHQIWLRQHSPAMGGHLSIRCLRLFAHTRTGIRYLRLFSHQLPPHHLLVPHTLPFLTLHRCCSTAMKLTIQLAPGGMDKDVLGEGEGPLVEG